MAQLHKIQEEKVKVGHSELPPVVGLIVVGHEWNCYIVYRGISNGQVKFADGSLGGALENLSTVSYHGVFKIMDLIRRVGAYLGEVHWPFWQYEILHPLANATPH